jgi:succinoglycan biosynthesis transport protein ExoP
LNGDFTENEGMSLRDYLGVLMRWWWLIVLITLAAGFSAYSLAHRKVPQYEASATLLYEMQMDVSNPLGGAVYIDPNATELDVGSAIAMLASPKVIDMATSRLGDAATKAGYSVSGTATTGSTDSSLVNGLMISAVSTSPQLAAAAANTYADVTIESRKVEQRARIDKAIAIVRSSLAGATQGSTDAILLGQRLRDLQIQRGTVGGSFKVVAYADAPTAPFAPRPKRSGILGIAVGLFAGIGIAFLLEQLDTSIRTEDRLVGIMRQPILGRVPRVPKKALEHGVLLTVTDPASPAAEAFRMLRSNLDFTHVDGDINSVLVTSSVQGEGKSVTACNLAVSLALAGKRIVIVDGDLRRPRVHKYFGVMNDVGVSTVASGKTKLADALQGVLLKPGNDNGPAAIAASAAAAAASLADDGSQNVPKLVVLPSGPLPPNPGEVVASKRFAAMIKDLEISTDIVIVDSPAMLAVGDTAALAGKVDGLVYLVDMKLMRRPMLQEAARRLGQVPCRKLGLVVIRHHQHAAYYRRHYYYTYVEGDDTQRKSRFGGMRVKARARTKV